MAVIWIGKKIVPIYKKCLNSASRGRGLGKNPVLRKIVKKTESVLKSNSAFVHGNEMFLDKWDALGLSINGVYNDFRYTHNKNCEFTVHKRIKIRKNLNNEISF